MTGTRTDPPRSGGSRDSAATKEALLAAGLEEFAAKGFDGTPVDSIARLAGVNKAMINYHFGGKEGLYRAILDAEFRWLEERLVDLRSAALDAPTRLERFVAVFGDLHARRPHLSQMMMREIMSGGRHLDESLLSRVLGVFSIVQSIVEAGVRQGAFRPVHPLLTHLTVIGSLIFFFASTPFRERLVLTGRLPVDMPSGNAFVRNLQKLMTEGLAPDRESGDG